MHKTIPVIGVFVCTAACGGSTPPDAQTTGTSTTTSGQTGQLESSSTAATAAADESSGSGTASSGSSSGDSTGSEEGNPLLSDRTLNIAHRGGAKHRPEETMLAFDHAVAIGVDVLELDVHASLDGVVVCMHDDTVDRTTDGTGAISSFTYAELQTLDAAFGFSPDGGRTFPYRGEGIGIATLAEVFAAHPEQHYALEIKQAEPPIVDAVVELIQDAGLQSQVVVASFNSETMLAVRAADPELLTSMALSEYGQFISEAADPGYEAPAGFVQAPWAGVTPAILELSAMHDIRVHAWTVNAEQDMRDLVELGVHGIITDDPELLDSILN